MSQATLFMFGAGVSMVLFTGVFLYAMYSFREWGARVALAEKQGYARDNKDPATPAKPNNALAE